MSVEVARTIIACIAGVGAVAWLFGLRAFLRLASVPHTVRAEASVRGVEPDETRKAVLRAGVAMATLAVLKTDNPIVAEMQSPGHPRIAVEFAGTPDGTAVTAVADCTRLDRGCRIAGGLLAVTGLAALVVLPTLLWYYVAPSENLGVRMQVIQTVQMVHLLWPQFLIASVNRKVRTMTIASMSNLIAAAETAG